MNEPSEGAVCAACGTVQPRAEMFGAEPDLLCGPCADEIRTRYARSWGPAARPRPPLVTSFVIAVAAALFVVSYFLRDKAPWVLYLVAGAPIWDGEVWRLVTTAFLHGDPIEAKRLTMGVLHIGFNAWWLWELGRGIESGWGHLALLGLVVGSAAVSTGAEWMVNAPGVGLSGVVYALAGFLFAFRKHHPIAAMLMNPRTANALATWFVICIVLTYTGSLRIANWAHGAGAVYGFLVGAAASSRARRLWVPLALVLTLAFVAATPYVAFGEQAERRDEHLARSRLVRGR